MAINPDFYVHESDRVALKALKAIPGFTPLLKAFMKVWSEKQFFIQNMSTNLRLSDKQLSKYYNMLPPICEKLGIDVPELYLELDVVPNAYTSGDTKPFIVITSGLLETMPEELIPTVLAHECGHIACHHVLYRTMGNLILSQAINYLGLGDSIAVLPIQVAFYYWMRCSELSADRAAVICDGTAGKMVEVCMRFAGYDKDIKEPASIQEFMNQAVEYKQMVKDSAWNKTLEFLMFHNKTHPLTAVRAYECDAWAKTADFHNINSYLRGISRSNGVKLLGNGLRVPMEYSSRHFVGRNHQEVVAYLQSIGFTNIWLTPQNEGGMLTQDGEVTGAFINGNKFEKGDWYPSDQCVEIRFYKDPASQQNAAVLSGLISAPEASGWCIGRNHKEVLSAIYNAGFRMIYPNMLQPGQVGWAANPGQVLGVTINGRAQFERFERFDPNAVVEITYLSDAPSGNG